jgi:hypothetical protein
MMNNYRAVFVLASDLGPETFGPLAEQTDDDIGLFQSYMLSGGSPQPRGFIIDGDQTADGLIADGHFAFLLNYLKASQRSSDYRAISGNPNHIANLDVQPFLRGGAFWSCPSCGGGTWWDGRLGVRSECYLDNDVLTPDVTAPAAQAGAFYENVGAQGPYVAAVYGPAGGSRPYNSLYMGWTIGLFGGMGTPGTLLSVGTKALLTGIVGGLMPQCFSPIGCPLVCIGVGDGSSFVQFMGLKSSNPMRSGQARIAFGILRSDKVQIRIYDVTGRVVRTVADRVFTAGEEHVVIWDGTNDTGQKVHSGVYFYQLKTPSWTSQRKLVVLDE